MSKLRVMLMADQLVGECIANYVIENYPDDLTLIVTTRVNEIYRKAREKKIPVCIFDSEANIIERLGGNIDLGVLAWWPKIIKAPLLRVATHGFLNTHPSLLPHNRGKHYNFWAIVEEAPFGVTLHFVDSGVDTGDILAQSKISYDWTDDGESLHRKAQIEIIQLFCDTYQRLRVGCYKAVQQIPDQGSFHRASELEQASKIDLDAKYLARDLLNLLRARTFKGHPGCWFEETGNRYEISLKIKKANE